MDQIHLELDASIEELERIGTAVSAFCERNGMDEKLRYSLQLVCDEWVSNVVLHGYGGVPPVGPGPPIELWLKRPEAHKLELIFYDRTPLFNPLVHPDPNLSLPIEERQAGGLGIHFIKKYMDHCEYARVGGQNRLTLTKIIQTLGEDQDEHKY